MLIGSLRFERGDFSRGDTLDLTEEEYSRLKESVQVITEAQVEAIKELKQAEAEAETKKKEAAVALPVNLKPATRTFHVPVEPEVAEDKLVIEEPEEAVADASAVKPKRKRK